MALEADLRAEYARVHPASQIPVALLERIVGSAIDQTLAQLASLAAD